MATNILNDLGWNQFTICGTIVVPPTRVAIPKNNKTTVALVVKTAHTVKQADRTVSGKSYTITLNAFGEAAARCIHKTSGLSKNTRVFITGHFQTLDSLNNNLILVIDDFAVIGLSNVKNYVSHTERHYLSMKEDRERKINQQKTTQKSE